MCHERLAFPCGNKSTFLGFVLQPENYRTDSVKHREQDKADDHSEQHGGETEVQSGKYQENYRECSIHCLYTGVRENYNDFPYRES